MNVNHSRWHHLASLVCLLALVFAQPVTARQNPPAAPALTPEEIKIYESFRAWIGSQPKDVQDAADDVVYQRYAAVLRTQGKSEQEATAAIVSLQSIGDRAEIERWNRILTAPQPRFNTAPNAFLVAVTTGLKPGRSLDVGMGQGRNTIYLAQHGWESVGVDPADRAVSAAQEEARRLGVTIATHVTRAEDFDWGTGAWDLIVLSYVGARDYAPKVVQALRPGGMVVVEGFHRDATKATPIGGAVVFETNELLQLFSALRVVRYEDVDAVSDFGKLETRVVRLAAVKR